MVTPLQLGIQRHDGEIPVLRRHDEFLAAALMQNDAVLPVEQGQAAAHGVRLLEQGEVGQLVVDAPAGRADQRGLGAAAAEHLAQAALRVRVVLFGLSGG